MLMVALAALQAAALPESPAAAASPIAASAALMSPGPTRRSCRAILKTGSRLNVRTVCRTIEEWADWDRVHQREVDEAISRTRGHCGGPTSGCEGE